MLYASYRPEDGSIYASAKVYDVNAVKYGQQLHDMGHSFVISESAGLLPPEHYWVNSDLQLSERPTVFLQATKRIFKCGDNDSTIITGFIKGSKATIWAPVLNEVIYPTFVVDAEELEISIPTPCTYKVVFDYWPYKSASIEIQAVA